MSVVNDSIEIRTSGRHHLEFPGGDGSDGKRHFSAVWTGSGNPGGTVVFSFDGNPGKTPAIMDFATGNNAFAWTVRVPEVDIDVQGIPDGGSFILYCR